MSRFRKRGSALYVDTGRQRVLAVVVNPFQILPILFIHTRKADHINVVSIIPPCSQILRVEMIASLAICLGGSLILNSSMLGPLNNMDGKPDKFHCFLNGIPRNLIVEVLSNSSKVGENMLLVALPPAIYFSRTPTQILELAHNI